MMGDIYSNNNLLITDLTRKLGYPISYQGILYVAMQGWLLRY